jgi:tetratricopeptide (TPR) repeat protein
LGLAADYGRRPSDVLAGTGCWVAAILLAALVALLAWRRPNPKWLGAAGIFVAALAPVLGIVPFRYQDISTVADRYAYLALLGPAWALALFVSGRRLPARAMALGGLCVLGCCSWHQQRFWHNTEALFTRALEVNPLSLPALTSLGDVYRVRGDFDRAQACLNRAIELIDSTGPQSEAKSFGAMAHYNLANVLADLGRTREAIDHYRRALAIDANFAKAHNNLGLALAAQGRPYEALDEYRQALRIKPANAKAHYNLGAALEQFGLRNEALSHYRQALRFDPRHADAWNNLANVQAALGRDDLAQPAYLEALRTDPHNYQAHYNLSLLLVRGGHYIKAREHLQRALEIQPRLEIAQRALDQLSRVR